MVRAVGVLDMRGKMRSVAVRFPAEHMRELNACAELWDVSFAEVVRRMVREYLEPRYEIHQ